ncbi:hypothetical protein GCM10011607_11580 [Shewanella inventionis]|uniref:Uncharacterized protein n=1 Tax=Shewanella inventionis TaxID=1738770 RepID=A0ABQ1IXB0_9GAMM|nr:hypothetical protein [Shewanella inventionis]GGB52747.1 hypothetical protein GCM10011607_11580 [Shewanella inventionis]
MLKDSNNDILAFIEFFGKISESVAAGYSDIEIDARPIQRECSEQLSYLKRICDELHINLTILL